MSYQKTVNERVRDFLPKYCQVNGCGKSATVTFVTSRGVQIARCSRHYMDDVDRRRLSATSDEFIEAMKHEVARQKEVGKELYAHDSFRRFKRFIGGF